MRVYQSVHRVVKIVVRPICTGVTQTMGLRYAAQSIEVHTSDGGVYELSLHADDDRSINWSGVNNCEVTDGQETQREAEECEPQGDGRSQVGDSSNLA